MNNAALYGLAFAGAVVLLAWAYKRVIAPAVGAITGWASSAPVKAEIAELKTGLAKLEQSHKSVADFLSRFVDAKATQSANAAPVTTVTAAQASPAFAATGPAAPAAPLSQAGV